MAPVGRMPERTRDRMVVKRCGRGRADCRKESGPRRLATLPALMQRIVILISGRGSNMEAICTRCAEQGWPAQVAAVIANRADAGGLAWAAARGIATAVVDHKAFPSREAFDA